MDKMRGRLFYFNELIYIVSIALDILACKHFTLIINLKDLLMKQLFLVLVLSLLSATNLNAQAGFVLKVGVNYSTLRNSDADFKRGYTFGIGKDWNIIKKVTIGSEIDYTTRGGLFNDKPIMGELYFPHDVYSKDIHIVVGYIEIPVLFKY